MSKRTFPLLPLFSLAVVLAAAVLPAVASSVQDRGLFGTTHTEPMRADAGTQPTAVPQRIDLVRRGTQTDDSDIISVVQQLPADEQRTALTGAQSALATFLENGVLPDGFPTTSCSYESGRRFLFRNRNTGESVSVYVLSIQCSAGVADLIMDVETGAVYSLNFFSKPIDPENDEGFIEKTLPSSAEMAAGFSKQLGVDLVPDQAGELWGVEFYRAAGSSSGYVFYASPYSVDATLNEIPSFGYGVDGVAGGDNVSIRHR
ncbi:MAG: hypothetical protein Q4C72_05835 [Eubacteriales bacterium]|nr:hypothetical protein [Eubacteriales bacterium]